MKKLILLAVVLVGAATASQAGVHFSLGLGIPLVPPPPVYVSPPPVVYTAPAPVYTAPAPVYTAPAPVISQGPAVVYQSPAPVVVASPPVCVAPAPVFCPPAPRVVVGFGFPGYGYRGHWRGHGWHR